MKKYKLDCCDLIKIIIVRRYTPSALLWKTKPYNLLSLDRVIRRYSPTYITSRSE